MGDAFQRSDVVESFVLVKDFVIPHELVKPQENEGIGGFELAIIHAVGGITIARRSELGNFPGGGKEEREQRHLGEYPECSPKFNEMALCTLIFEGRCQWVGFIKHNEDIRKCKYFWRGHLHSADSALKQLEGMLQLGVSGVVTTLQNKAKESKQKTERKIGST